MKTTTITISKDIKEFLENLKGEYEKKLNRKITWDEFLELLAIKSMTLESHLELTDDEAKAIREITIKGREGWRRSA